MKLWFLTGLSLLLSSLMLSPGYAQSTEKSAWGYGFFGGGGASGCGDSEGLIHFGGGMDAALAGGFGISIEGGYLTWGGMSEGVGLFSPGVMYAFNRDRKTIPFITGGYSLFFRSGSASGLFFGGGVNHFIGENWGIRVEGRDQLFFESGCTFHNLEARIGVVFNIN